MLKYLLFVEIHFLCQSFVRRYCESNKLNGRLGDHGTGFPCGQENCKRIMLWAPVNRVLINRETAARLDKRMTDEALRDIEGIELYSPFYFYHIDLISVVRKIVALAPSCQILRECNSSLARIRDAWLNFAGMTTSSSKTVKLL